MNISVLIVAFNRPELTAQVFERVRQAKPARLFLCLDAPRANRPDDVAKNEAVKRIFEHVEWECEVYRDYAARNLGCDPRMASGIAWAFEHTDELIILEDDCVPDITFFTFCHALLERYRNDSRVGMIAGHVEHFERVEELKASYYFNHIPITLGWATWRRVWEKFDSKMVDWPQFVQSRMLYNLFEEDTARIIESLYQRFYCSRIPWDCAFGYALMKERLLCVHPCRNLVTNIGFVPDATHSTDTSSPFSNVPASPMAFPLAHPTSMISDAASEWCRVKMFRTPPFAVRAARKALRCVRRIFAAKS